MALPPENQASFVENPSVELLLKQIYSTYKKEVKSLTDKLSQANEKLSSNTPCSFCSNLGREVEDLRNQVRQLLQATPRITTDACVQTDTPVISVPSSQNSNKRIIIDSSPRKRTSLENFVKKSPLKTDKSDAYISDEEDVLAPNTPERDPQREGRVKRWLQTMEIPETIDPDMLQGRLLLDSHCSIAGHNERLDDAETPDLDATMLPQNWTYNSKQQPKNANPNTMQGRTLDNGPSNAQCHKERPGETETDDFDETMLPQNWVNKKTEMCNNNQQLKNDELDHSSATSEDLLEGAVLRNKNKKEQGKLKVLADVGNKTLDKRNVTALKQSVLPFKYKSGPVRKRAERMQLPAQQCADCAKYYQNDDTGQKCRDICSRHRAIHVAPATPPNFWEIDFPDTQLCKERGYLDTTQKVKMPARRKRPFVQQ